MQLLRCLSVASALVIGAWMPFEMIRHPLPPGGELLQDLLVAAAAAVNLALYAREHECRRARDWLRLGVALDLLCCVPLSLVRPLSVPALLWAARLAKLLAARHAARIKAVLDDLDGISPLLYRLIPIGLFLPPLVHVVACAWIGLGSGSAGPLPEDPLLEYARAVYWAFTTLTTVGYGDIVPKTVPQMALAACVQVMGVGVFGYVLSNVASLLSRMDAAREHHVDNVERAEDFMTANRIPRHLRMRVRSYFHYLWKTHKGYNNRELIAQLPAKFQSELLTFINRSMVERVPFLQDASPELMEDLMRELKPKIFVPGERIFRMGEQGHAMYLIHSGVVEILGADQKKIVELRDGAFFGEMALVHDQPRNATAMAVTYCDVYTLGRDSFQLVIAAYPEFREHIVAMSEARAAGNAA